jgi:intracellular septation protein
MLDKEISLPDTVWQKINWAWAGFFSLCAAVNVYIAFRLPLDVWVNFKVFGLLAATFTFMLLTGAYIYRHMPKEQSQDKQ